MNKAFGLSFVLGAMTPMGVALRLWGPQSLLGSNTWSNSLIISNYPAASAWRHDLMFPAYENDIYTLVPGVNSPVENRSCSESARFLCRVCDTIQLVPVRFRWTGRGLVVRTLGIIADGGVALRFWGPQSLLGSSTWSNLSLPSNYIAPVHGDMFSCFLHTKIISIHQCQV